MIILQLFFIWIIIGIITFILGDFLIMTVGPAGKPTFKEYWQDFWNEYIKYPDVLGVAIGLWPIAIPVYIELYKEYKEEYNE